MTSIESDLEREILLDALDEDAVLSAVENIALKFQKEIDEVLRYVVALSKQNLVGFYDYGVSNRAKISAVKPDQLAEEIRAHPFEIFLVRTDSTINRLAQLNAL